MRFLLFLVLFVNLILLFSCKKHVPADGTFFIKPTLVSVTTTTNQGSGSHKITDNWLYVDGKFQGIYPAGSLMPIHSNGQHVKINILPGIKNNGISDTRISWVFYDILTFDTLVQNGLTVERPLTFKYNPNVTFAWKENFDPNSPGFTLIKSPDSQNPSDTTWKPASAANCFEGGGSAEIGLAGKDVGAQAFLQSSIGYPMPMGQSNVYLEINYKGNERFEVGVLSGTTQKSILYVSPSENWNKIYIQLADAVNRTPTSTLQKIYFKLVKNADNSDPKIFLDNIKLVYF